MRGRLLTRLLGPSKPIPIRNVAVTPARGPQGPNTCYVMVVTAVGKANEVARAVHSLSSENAWVISCETVSGPFDVIVQLGAQDLNALANAVTKILEISGVDDHKLCPASSI